MIPPWTVSSTDRCGKSTSSLRRSPPRPPVPLHLIQIRREDGGSPARGPPRANKASMKYSHVFRAARLPAVATRTISKNRECHSQWMGGTEPPDREFSVGLGVPGEGNNCRTRAPSGKGTAVRLGTPGEGDSSVPPGKGTTSNRWRWRT